MNDEERVRQLWAEGQAAAATIIRTALTNDGGLFDDAFEQVKRLLPYINSSAEDTAEEGGLQAAMWLAQFTAMVAALALEARSDDPLAAIDKATATAEAVEMRARFAAVLREKDGDST